MISSTKVEKGYDGKASSLISEFMIDSKDDKNYSNMLGDVHEKFKELKLSLNSGKKIVQKK